MAGVGAGRGRFDCMLAAGLAGSRMGHLLTVA